MKSLTKNEIEFINRIIENKKENFFVEYKREYKPLYQKNSVDSRNVTGDEINEGIYSFIKETLGFLNEPSPSNKYLIYGIDDDGKVWGVNEKLSIQEQEIQGQIAKYISPTPLIRIIDNFIYDDKRLVIFKIDKSNQQKIYSCVQRIEKKNKKGKVLEIRKGDTFARNGTRSELITSMSATSLIKGLENSMFTLLTADNSFDISKTEDILFFVEILDLIVDKNLFINSTANNINFRIRFNESFEKYATQGEFKKINSVPKIDGGINSICDSIFYIAKLLYDIKEKNFFTFNLRNTKLILDANNNEVDNLEYVNTKKSIKEINELLKQYIGFQHNYGNCYFFKITELEFTKSLKELYGEKEMKFSVSDNVLTLFLKPLYISKSSLEVAIRELLQNSFDALKKQKNNENQNMMLSFYFENDKFEKVILEDNGIGMDLKSINEYYLTIGESSKSDDSETGFIGKFGIGALANFLIGDTCKIITKKENEYLEYSFKIRRENFVVESLVGKKIDTKENSYTKIEIDVKEEFSNYSIENVIEELDLEDTIIKDNINFQIPFIKNSELFYEIKVPKIDLTDRTYFTKIEFSKSCNIYVFDRVKYEQDKEVEVINEKNNTKEVLEKIDKYNNKVLYSNQIGEIEFKVPLENRNFTYEHLPLIIIDGFVSEAEGYLPELSRSIYKLESRLAWEIIENRYEVGLPKIIEQIKILNEESDNPWDEISEIQKFSKKCNIKLLELVFSENHIELYTGNQKIDIKLYVNNLSSEHMKNLIVANQNYVKKTLYSDKSNIADVLQYEDVLFLNRSFIDKYILNANGSQNGFRYSALVTILESLSLKNLLVGKTVGELWVNLNKDANKKILTEKMNSIQINGLIPLCKDGSDLLRNMEKTDLEYPYIVACKNPIVASPDNLFINEYKKIK